jgi:hypothetical protein
MAERVVANQIGAKKKADRGIEQPHSPVVSMRQALFQSLDRKAPPRIIVKEK